MRPGAALKSAPRSKRWLASVCRPWRRAVRRTAMGSNHAASTRTLLVAGVIIVSQPPMTPARPRGFDVVGDDKVFGIEDAVDAVEGLELFTLARAAHDDAAFDLVEVEGVRGLAHGEPCEVGRIDCVGDLLLLEEAEVGADFGAGEPVARFGDGDAAEDARGEAAAGIFGFDLELRKAVAAGPAAGSAKSSGLSGTP